MKCIVIMLGRCTWREMEILGRAGRRVFSRRNQSRKVEGRGTKDGTQANEGKNAENNLYPQYSVCFLCSHLTQSFRSRLCLHSIRSSRLLVAFTFLAPIDTNIRKMALLFVFGDVSELQLRYLSTVHQKSAAENRNNTSAIIYIGFVHQGAPLTAPYNTPATAPPSTTSTGGMEKVCVAITAAPATDTQYPD